MRCNSQSVGFSGLASPKTTIHQNFKIMNNGEKATALLNYLEELDSKTIINILNPLLDDDALALLYDQLVKDGFL